MNNIYQKNGCLMYYGNPSGYLKDTKATIDLMFKSKELEAWLEERNLNADWKEGVFERLAKGERLNMSDEAQVILKNVRIWQLKPDSDFDLRFRDYDETVKSFGEPSRCNYQTVYDGELNTNDLEEIYSKFNINYPEGFTGHSLSISDVIELYDEDGSTFHYVDRVGFKTIAFDNPEPKQGITMNM